MARIAFITADLSQGSGIGDYVRLFAVECVCLGHTVQIHGLNDNHSSDYITEVICVDDKTIQVHRWSRRLNCAFKCRQSRKLLELFEPDWVSLQFEFYYFSNKGLMPFAWHLPAVLKGYQVHLMMHELWVRFNSGEDWREQLKGVVRYLQCRHMIKKIRPLCAHTSVQPYAEELKHLLPGIKLLSVPSNIPVSREASVTLPTEIAGTIPGERSQYLLVILFGRITQEWESGDSLKLIDEAAKCASRNVRLISIGENGYGDMYWNRLVDQMPSGWRSIKLGWRDHEFVSRTLQGCDLAISSTPFSLSGKSGTTAAFLEHNLPVLFAEKRPSQEEISAAHPGHFHELLHFTDQPLQLEALANRRAVNPESHVSLRARQFIDDLFSASTRITKTAGGRLSSELRT